MSLIDDVPTLVKLWRELQRTSVNKKPDVRGHFVTKRQKCDQQDIGIFRLDCQEMQRTLLSGSWGCSGFSGFREKKREGKTIDQEWREASLLQIPEMACPFFNQNTLMPFLQPCYFCGGVVREVHRAFVRMGL